MTREMKSEKVGRKSVNLSQTRVNGKTTFHIDHRIGYLYIKCEQANDIDQALSIYDEFIHKYLKE